MTQQKTISTTLPALLLAAALCLPLAACTNGSPSQTATQPTQTQKEEPSNFTRSLIENGFTRSVDRSEYDDSCYFQATTEDRCMGADVSFYDTSTYRDKTSMSATVGFTQYGLGYQAGLRQSQQ